MVLGSPSLKAWIISLFCIKSTLQNLLPNMLFSQALGLFLCSIYPAFLLSHFCKRHCRIFLSSQLSFFISLLPEYKAQESRSPSHINMSHSLAIQSVITFLISVWHMLQESHSNYLFRHALLDLIEGVLVLRNIQLSIQELFLTDKICQVTS